MRDFYNLMTSLSWELSEVDWGVRKAFQGKHAFRDKFLAVGQGQKNIQLLKIIAAFQLF